MSTINPNVEKAAEAMATPRHEVRGYFDALAIELNEHGLLVTPHHVAALEAVEEYATASAQGVSFAIERAKAKCVSIGIFSLASKKPVERYSVRKMVEGSPPEGSWQVCNEFGHIASIRTEREARAVAATLNALNECDK